MEKIGNVVLNDRFYKGTDAYSDGDIEEKILQIVRQEDSYEDRLMRENEWALLYHLSPIRENLLEWYSFGKESTLNIFGSTFSSLMRTFIFSSSAESISSALCFPLPPSPQPFSESQERTSSSLFMPAIRLMSWSVSSDFSLTRILATAYTNFRSLMDPLLFGFSLSAEQRVSGGVLHLAPLLVENGA